MSFLDLYRLNLIISTVNMRCLQLRSFTFMIKGWVGSCMGQCTNEVACIFFAKAKACDRSHGMYLSLHAVRCLLRESPVAYKKCLHVILVVMGISVDRSLASWTPRREMGGPVNDFPMADIHSGTLTWQRNIPILNRTYIFKWSIFHCHVSLTEGNLPISFLHKHRQQLLRPSIDGQ